MELEEIVYSLPSTQTFFDKISRAVRDQVVIVLLPDSLSREMVGRLLRNRLNLIANFSFSELTTPIDPDPLTASSRAMNASWPSDRTRKTTRNLLRCTGLPDVLYVHRIGPADSGWAEFIGEWATERLNLRDSGQARLPSLCVIAKLRDFDFDPPAAGPGLTYFWWWGFPSALEVRLSCRIAGLQAGDTVEVSKWREFVLPSLVSSDIQLAERIWGDVAGEQSAVVNRLVDYWQNLEDPACTAGIDDLLDLMKGERGAVYTVGQEVPTELHSSWSSGKVLYTPEYGLEVHPAFLAYTNHTAEVQKVMWRGQAELLLPILNEIRLRICTLLTDRYGSDWPYEWGLPTSAHELEQVQISPLAAELGYLHYLFDSAVERKLPVATEMNLARLVQRARELRNSIAHNRSVDFRDFKILGEALSKAGI